MKGKQRRPNSWLPNQVVYGIDCSDPDPEKWTPFGEAVEAAAREEQHPPKTANKPKE